MSEIINLDALVVNTITINKPLGDGTVCRWDLRDDIPDIIGFLVLRLPEYEERLTEEGISLEETTLRYAAYEQALTHICGEIFRHTDPATTDEALRTVFSFAERRDLVKLFFTLLMPRLRQRQDATAMESQSPLQQAIAKYLAAATQTVESQPAGPSASHLSHQGAIRSRKH